MIGTTAGCRPLVSTNSVFFIKKRSYRQKSFNHTGHVPLCNYERKWLHIHLWHFMASPAVASIEFFCWEAWDHRKHQSMLLPGLSSTITITRLLQLQFTTPTPDLLFEHISTAKRAERFELPNQHRRILDTLFFWLIFSQNKPAISTFLSEQISTSHQPNERAANKKLDRGTKLLKCFHICKI
jgi:hypothetical protein